MATEEWSALQLATRRYAIRSIDTVTTQALAISIVSHGQMQLTRQLLADLNAIASPERMNVLVTINIPEPTPSSDEFANLDLVWIRNDRPAGFGANHNHAFSRCAARWFAVLNPDIRLAEDPFPRLVQAIGEHDMCGVVSPRILGPSGDTEDHVRGNLSPIALLRRKLRLEQLVDFSRPAVYPGTFYWLAGMFMVFDAGAFKAVGGFDERYFLYCEDYDICARLYLSGYSVAVVPEARVVHCAQRSSRHSVRYFFWHVTSLVKVWISKAFWFVVLAVKPKGVLTAASADKNLKIRS